MNKKEIKKLTELNSELRTSVEEYVDDYVEWVSTNVPAELEYAFGVGIVLDCRYGTYWGYENENGDYVQTGGSWNVANDFQLTVQGSSSYDARKFAEKIPELLKKGLEAIKNENEALEVVLRKKV